MFLLLGTTLGIIAASCSSDEAPELSILGEQSYSVPAEGQTLKIGLRTNQDDWAATSTDSWIQISKADGGAQVTVDPNETYDSRAASITFYAPASGKDRASAIVSIHQEAKVFVGELSVSPAGDVEIPSEGQTLAYEVATNYPSWDAESSEGWLLLEKSGSGFTLSAEANSTRDERRATVSVYAPAKDGYEAKVEFTLTQAGAGTIDLTSDGVTSNCYVIYSDGSYSFRADVRGNGRGCEGLPSPLPLTPKGATLVWQTSVGMITSVSLAEDGSIHFEASDKAGNALIAATDSDGGIIWSWHIWHPGEEISSLSSQSGAKVMNFNLGALNSDHTSVDSYGLLYQWGRKDPLPGSPIMDGGDTYTTSVDVYDMDGKKVAIRNSSWYSTQDNTLAYSIANPTVCLSNYAQYYTSRDWLVPSESNTALWGNPTAQEGEKTFYDPCPKGWRVPDPSTFRHFTSSGGYTWATGDTEGVMTFHDLGGDAEFRVWDFDGNGQINLLDFTDGWWFYLDKENISYFPATTRYDGSYAMFMGSMVGLWGNYWYNAPTLDGSGNDTYLGAALSFGIKEYGQTDYTVTASPLSNGSRADAYAVRCVRE